MTEKEFRSSIIAKRKALSEDYKEIAERIVFSKIIGMDEYKNAENILIYLDYNGEIRTGELIDYSLKSNKNVYVPLCKDNCVIDFYKIVSKDELVSGHYGILEPIEKDTTVFSIKDLAKATIILVPGTVFDKQRNRMGYGKGYYDRFLERFNIDVRIGLAYDFQIIDKINVKPSDIAMTAIITDKLENKND